MNEQYKSNVQALCDRLGLPNPIRKDDITICRLQFYQQGGKFVDILATDMNRAGFLYFQEKFSSDGFLVNYVTISTLFKVVAARHFAELWVDAEIECRPLIKAIKTARAINISWHTKFPLP